MKWSRNVVSQTRSLIALDVSLHTIKFDWLQEKKTMNTVSSPLLLKLLHNLLILEANCWFLTVLVHILLCSPGIICTSKEKKNQNSLSSKSHCLECDFTDDFEFSQWLCRYFYLKLILNILVIHFKVYFFFSLINEFI